MMLAPDLRLGERYTLVSRIAGGGMGEVWRGHDDVLARTVAVKVLRPDIAADPGFRERFRVEARTAASLSHPGIASVYDYGEVDGVAYLVMELVDGEPLSAVLARDGRLPTERALDVVGQVAFALQAAHDTGVVHRDVKPANILLRRDGTVKVTDFGIARAAGADQLTRTGELIGTAHYLSPEQSAGQAATAASDIYCLGVVAYECLSGRRPFVADSPVAVALSHLNDTPPPLPDDLPADVVTLVQQAMDKDPARRPASAADMGRTALMLRERLPLLSPSPPRPSEPVVTAPAPVPTKVLPVPPTTRDRQRSQRYIRNMFLLLTVVVVGLGALVLRACTGGSSPAHGHVAPSTRPTAHASPSVRHVLVQPAAYLDRPYSQVRAELRALGLQVRRSTLPTAGPADTVLSVLPAGQVPVGSTVTVTVAAPPAPVPPPHHKQPPGHGKKTHGKKAHD